MTEGPVTEARRLWQRRHVRGLLAEMTTSVPRSNRAERWLRRTAPLVPYVAVLIGLYLFESGWASILVYHVAAVTVLATTGAWRTRFRPTKRLAPALLTAVIVGSALVGPVIYGAWSRVHLGDVVLNAELESLGLSGVAWTAFAVYYFTVNPVIEEYFWRGYLGSTRRGIAASDLWFAGYHVFVVVLFVGTPWILVSFLGLTAAAWIWRQIATATGGLLIPVVSHAVADASLIVAAIALTQ
jgi:membrane protease YdiL (CAAX protease family)